MVREFEFPEGATPIADSSGLIPSWVHSLEDLNRVEAENIAYAQQKYLKKRTPDPKKWFHTEKLKMIHHEMFGKVWTWAGKYRQSTTSIGIKPALIPLRLAELCSEVTSWSEYPVALSFVERAARIHHQLVLIHPFENGNGRFARLVADRFLLAWKCSHPMWPNVLNQDGHARKHYIQALKSSDGGDSEPLIRLMKEWGAKDPSISELMKNPFYQSCISGEKGALLVKALLRMEENRAEDPSLMVFAKKMGLEEQAVLLEIE